MRGSHQESRSFAARRDWGSDNQRRVFIVGMPRYGRKLRKSARHKLVRAITLIESPLVRLIEEIDPIVSHDAGPVGDGGCWSDGVRVLGEKCAAWLEGRNRTTWKEEWVAEGCGGRLAVEASGGG